MSTNPSPGSQLQGNNDFETFIMMMAGLAAAGWLIGQIPRLFHQLPSWLVAHGVLAESSSRMVAVPGFADAGLDGPRLIVALGLLVVGVALVLPRVLAGRRAHADTD